MGGPNDAERRSDRLDAIVAWTAMAVVVQVAAPCFGAPLGVVFGTIARRRARADLEAIDAGAVDASRRAWIVAAERVARVAVWVGAILMFVAALALGSSMLSCLGLLNDGGRAWREVRERTPSMGPWAP